MKIEEGADYGMLDPVKHKDLIERMDWVCDLVGIMPEHLMKSASDWFTEPSEGRWLQTLPQQCGGFYEGEMNPPVIQRMMAIAGALSRYFVDARILPVERAINLAKSDLPQVLIIPDFPMVQRGKIADWRITALSELLYSSLTRRRVLLSIDPPSEKDHSGLGDFVRANYTRMNRGNSRTQG